MDLRSMVSTRFHKETSHKIADWIGSNQDRFTELMDLVLGDDDEISKYSSWIINHCMEENPQLIEPHVEAMILNLDKPNLNDSVIRSTVKALSETNIPEHLQGRALELCYNYLLDPKTAIAIRVHAMQMIFNISKNEPDLLRELQVAIQDWMPHGSAGFKSRGNKILKKISRILKQ